MTLKLNFQKDEEPRIEYYDDIDDNNTIRVQQTLGKGQSTAKKPKHGMVNTGGENFISNIFQVV